MKWGRKWSQSEHIQFQLIPQNRDWTLSSTFGHESPLWQNKHSAQQLSNTFLISYLTFEVWLIRLWVKASRGAINVTLICLLRSVTRSGASVCLPLAPLSVSIRPCAHPDYNMTLSAAEQARTWTVTHFSLSQEALSCALCAYREKQWAKLQAWFILI